MKLQLEEAKRICEITSRDLLKMEKEHQDLEEEIVKLIREIEQRKDKLNMRTKYEGSTKALDKMLSQQTKSKDTSGLGFEEVQSSNSKDTSSKEIRFTSLGEGEVKKTFTVSKDTSKKTYTEVARNHPTNWYAQPMNWRPHSA